LEHELGILPGAHLRSTTRHVLLDDDGATNAIPLPEDPHVTRLHDSIAALDVVVRLRFATDESVRSETRGRQVPSSADEARAVRAIETAAVRNELLRRRLLEIRHISAHPGVDDLNALRPGPGARKRSVAALPFGRRLRGRARFFGRRLLR